LHTIYAAAATVVIMHTPSPPAPGASQPELPSLTLFIKPHTVVLNLTPLLPNPPGHHLLPTTHSIYLLLLQLSQAESLVEERDEEIRRVVETITELAQIMRDLSTLVVEQGSMLDRIDANVGTAAAKVEEGVRELVRAERTQRGGRAMMCILFLIAMIVLMLVIAIVRHI
jgi:SNARE domain